MTQILILCALRDEYAPVETVHPVRYSGIGKVNAALATVQALHELRPQWVVNYGTAGAVAPGLTGLHEVARTVQRDMAVEPFAPRGTVPFFDGPAVLESGRPGIVCGSGDSFVAGEDPWLRANGVEAVDMELFAIAEACRRFGVPWRSFKYITDAADGAAAGDWQTNVRNGAAAFASVLARLQF